MPDIGHAYAEADLQASGFDEYIDWRAEHPSDDLMTELLQAEFEDETGTVRRLSRRGGPRLRQPAGRGGQRDDHPADRLDRQGAGRASRQRRRAGRGPQPGAQRHRGAPPLRVAVTGPGPLRHQGRRAPRAGGAGRERHPPAQRRRPTATSASSPTATASTSTARSTTTWPSATASTSASGSALARLEGRVALDEVLQRFPTWEVDWDNAVQARTSTVRGWEQLPVLIVLSSTPDPPSSSEGRSVDENSGRRRLERAGPVHRRRARPAGGARWPCWPGGTTGWSTRPRRPAPVSLAIACDVTDEVVVPVRHRGGAAEVWVASTPWSTPPASDPWPDWPTPTPTPGGRRSTPT